MQMKYLANTLFQIKVRYKKYGWRLQWFITIHVSFKEHILMYPYANF